MPGCSVSIVDYLTIEIACHHTTVQRSLIAGYFDITVNALNARLRTCADRLEAFPDLVTYGVNLLELAKQQRPDFENRVHPIWELSKRLIQSQQNGTLEQDLDGQDGQRGALLSFLLQTDFRVNGHMPRERPKDDAVLVLPRGRKRKLAADSNGKLASMYKEEADDGPVILKEVTGQETSAKKVKNNIEVEADGEPQDLPQSKSTTVEKATGKGSRSEPYTEHELCTIYIARRIRLLDWDTISFALSRFRTPTVAILADARTAFDQYHDLIVETLRLCCWPQDSMYLISCAASECLAARDRGQWSEETKNFRQDKGELYHIYMQRRLERIYKKSFETSNEKRHRRRRERLLGYEGLSVEDYMNLPDKKKAGSQPGKTIDKVRKRRTKEEMQKSAEEKAAARAVLKAAGLKANGEALAEKRKVAAVTKSESVEGQQSPDVTLEATSDMAKKKTKPSKAPRRKYDISEQEKLAFSASSAAMQDRRQRYFIEPDDQAPSKASPSLDRSRGGTNGDGRHSTEQTTTERLRHEPPKSMIIGHAALRGSASPEVRRELRPMTMPDRSDSQRSFGRDQQYTNSTNDLRANMPVKGLFAPTVQHSNGHYSTDHRAYATSSHGRSPQEQTTRSPHQGMSIGDLLGRPQQDSHVSQVAQGMRSDMRGSFESAATSLFSSANTAQSRGRVEDFSRREEPRPPESPRTEKPRSSLSLSALLN